MPDIHQSTIEPPKVLHVLHGMLPICGFCKRIGDESGGWLQLERYIAERSEARFTHTFPAHEGRALVTRD